jgi:molybdopterin-containing oxidoreductase family iron-sulfur binding subunit
MSCRKDLRAGLASLEQAAGANGRRLWTSLQELSNTTEFQRLIEREFPVQASDWPDSLSRRKFLTLMGASLALGGIAGCSVKPAPSTQIVPYVRSPEEVIPGKPLFYATAMTLDGAAVGLLIETHMGRPTKAEGNPDHPASLGATSIFHQASVLELYDPDRSQTVRHLGQTRTWDEAIAAIQSLMQSLRAKNGAGLRLLTQTVVSPTLQEQIRSLLQQCPEAKWHVYEPLNHDSEYRASQLAFGEVVTPRYDFTRANVVVALDADFLASGPEFLRYASDFMQRRRVRTSVADAAQAEMNRLYAVETAVSPTGAKADHRLAVRACDVEQLAKQLAVGIGLSGIGQEATGAHSEWIAAVARDLQLHRGRSLVLAGQRQPAAVHFLAHAINERLGNVGSTVEYIEPLDAQPISRIQSLRDLTSAMQRGDVDVLLMLGGNPVYDAPADIAFTEELKHVGMRIYSGLYENETSRLCDWHLPEAHYLEAWSDSQAYDGTASIVQPVIEPLHAGRSVHEIMAIVSQLPQPFGREIIRDHWRRKWGLDEQAADEFEARWQTVLHDGVIAGTRAVRRNVTLATDWLSKLEQLTENISTTDANSTADRGDLELNFLSDPAVYDGRFANNGWLQELPKPLTKLTWGNAAIMSPATARRLELGTGSYAHGGEHGGYYMPVVGLEIGQQSVEAPLWIMPGHADDTVTVYLGFGREYAGHIGGTPDETVGANAYRLRTSRQLWFASGLKVTDLGRTALVACTQEHHRMEEREPARSGSLEQYQQKPDFAGTEQEQETRNRSERAQPPLNLYEAFNYGPPKHKWGMVIDLTSCVGCNACIVACQAENNIPVVGKEQVARGREMHWIRLDRYIEGPADRPDAFHFQPLPCMHCENAPCEYVCPVEATVHSAEGLNDMIYNRCVGTRFCSNNCPYKVRRFNFLAFADFRSPGQRMQYNPDVTVRSRGVMEKCTYCVQRIRHAEIGEETSGRPIVDGGVLTACQAACPTQAIVFGDMNDSQSKVKQWKDSPLHYALLDDLNTFPRTTYLAQLRNPNPELEQLAAENP